MMTATTPPIATMIIGSSSDKRGAGKIVEFAFQILGRAFEHQVELASAFAAGGQVNQQGAGIRPLVRIAPERLPPLRTASTISSLARASTVLRIVPPVSRSPSSSGSRLATIVASVRAIRAA